jgi:L-ascorbate metabolism protein UlaG (beta-lactamase superfamily)
MRLALALCALAFPALAEGRLPSDCLALAQGEAPLVQVALREDQVRIRYLGHASFAIQTPQILAVTDYTGSLGDPAVVPDVVTMNNAHDSHYTDHPDPRIPLVVKGWPDQNGPAALDLDLGEMRLRNVTSDLRGPFGEGALQDGNSIFIFEAAGLCIGHLSHLHQILTPAQRGAIGRLDVVMVPVDGAFTMSTAAMAEEVRRFHPRLVLPMHWFSQEGLALFLAAMREDYRVTLAEGPEIMLSRDRVPVEPEVLVLQPQLFAPGEAR